MTEELWDAVHDMERCSGKQDGRIPALDKRIKQLEQLGFSQAVLIMNLQLDLTTAEAHIAGMIAWQQHFPTAAMAVHEAGRVIAEIMEDDESGLISAADIQALARGSASAMCPQ